MHVSRLSEEIQEQTRCSNRIVPLEAGWHVRDEQEKGAQAVHEDRAERDHWSIELVGPGKVPGQQRVPQGGEPEIESPGVLLPQPQIGLGLPAGDRRHRNRAH